MRKKNKSCPHASWNFGTGFSGCAALALLCVLLTCLPFSAYGQSAKTVSLKFNNAPMSTVLMKIEDKTGYKMDFTYDEIQSYKVTVNVKNATVDTAMKAVLKGTPLSYSISGKFITVFRSKQSQVKMSKMIPARKVLGRVIDENGDPVIGASVYDKDNRRYATVSDNDGSFSLLTAPETRYLTLSYLGMKTVTLNLSGKKDFYEVRMEPDHQQIGETVVTGLFNYKASSFTGSASTYTSEELKQVGNQNLLKSLANLDPSFIIDDNYLNGSNPNAFNDITIRGNTSFAGLQSDYDGNPNEPLFIVDGFESTREAVFDLDMNRVKSVTILKDAAAKAMYGAKAANGVVVVETIEPEKGRLRITYTGDLNIEAPDLSSYDLCNAAEKLQVEQNAGRYTATSPTYQQSLREQYNDILENIERGVDTYWLAKPLRTGVGTKHTAYLEGGDERMRYSATIGYNGIAGVMKGSDRRTISGNIKLSYRYKDFLFRNSLSITSNKADDSPYGSFSDYASANPYNSPYDENGNLRKVLGVFTPAGYNASQIVYYNPLYNATIGTKNFSKYTEYTENFYIEWRPLEQLRLTGRIGYTYKTTKREDFYPGDHTMYVNWTGENYFKRGSYSITDGEAQTLSSDITANYNLQLGKHLLMANAAWSLNSTISNTHGMTAWGFINNHVDNITFAKQYADNGKPSGSEATTRSIGLTGAVNYSYDDRYLADLTLRYNGSSAFGSNNRWGTFWSAGLGWNLHKEKFMKALPWVNLLKLRGSYGLTGSQNFNPYQAKATYNYYTDVVYDNITGAYLMAMANNELKWQQTADLNVGFDMQIFSRFNVRLDVYRSKTKDALLPLTLPTSTGFTSYQENLGNVQNMGFDLSANWKFWSKGSDYLTLNGSISHNKNKVVKINDALKSFNDSQEENASDNGTTSPVIRYEEGQSMTAIWAVRSLGIDPATGRELFLKKDGTTTTYDYDTDDKVVVGDSNPKYHGNFGLSGEYRGIGLSFTFSYRFGGDYYNQTLVDRVENVDIAYNVDRRVLSDTWNSVGDIATYKKITSSPSTTYPTSRFVERNNELQLASVSCYYDFKYQQWLRKLKMERLRLSFYMSDLFRISTVKAERGLDYPYARSFSFSLTATF